MRKVNSGDQGPVAQVSHLPSGGLADFYTALLCVSLAVASCHGTSGYRDVGDVVLLGRIASLNKIRVLFRGKRGEWQLPVFVTCKIFHILLKENFFY